MWLLSIHVMFRLEFYTVMQLTFCSSKQQSTDRNFQVCKTIGICEQKCEGGVVFALLEDREVNTGCQVSLRYVGLNL